MLQVQNAQNHASRLVALQARRQHLVNLLAILDRCLLRGDMAMTAATASLALAVMVRTYTQLPAFP